MFTQMYFKNLQSRDKSDISVGSVGRCLHCMRLTQVQSPASHMFDPPSTTRSDHLRSESGVNSEVQPKHNSNSSPPNFS